MQIELNDKEVALLLGLLGATSGYGLGDVYHELMRYAMAENMDIRDVAGFITEELIDHLKGNTINEDKFYNDAILQWNEQEGLI